jgi:hypothetical protein
MDLIDLHIAVKQAQKALDLASFNLRQAVADLDIEKLTIAKSPVSP